MTDWSALSHAYGSAEDIPALLSQLETEPSETLWSSLWSRLWHQGSVYSASYATLPWLADFVVGDAPLSERDGALILAAAIFAESAHRHEAAGVREQYADQVARLHQVASERVLGPAPEYVYLLQALMAFEDVAVWGENLDGLSDGEYEVTCPKCWSDLFIAISDEYGFFSSNDDYAVKDVEKTPLRPVDPGAMEPLSGRLHDLAMNAGEESLAVGLRHLFGKAECTDCGTVFPVAERVVEAREY